jgi:Tol biopolymer transport system component/C-terminal processing protease CtpA/Prc
MKKLSILSLLILMTCIVFADERPLWMRYPAISPDGNTIVFSYQGDLYTVPVTGGEARLLTLHEAYDFSAVWSPDSKSIAFASARYGGFDIFSIPATGGKAKRLTTNSGGEISQSFTPDGKYILFHALIQDDPLNAQFPTGAFTELYKVSIEGGRPERVLTTPALGATYSNDGKNILYYDRKGYENNWRKHHISSVTRDIWLYESETGKHRKLTSFEGEDRYPVYSPDGNTVYYLSERDGSFNVWAMPLSGDADARQLSSYENHPLRFLSISNDGTLCFGYNGELYTGTESKGFMRVPVIIENDDKVNNVVFMKEGKGATEIDVSPDGKEIVFIIRGEVFVTSTDFNTTKRITNTPQQERSVSFSPDGRSILYASERDSSWNIYQSKIVNDDEPYFANATLLEESVVIATEKEEFQPRYSPDGKEVAFIEEREILKVVHLDSKETRTILPKQYNYSYADGDQHYDWSPDGKWFLVTYSENSAMHNDVALVDAEGKQEIVNLTNSGYSDGGSLWMMDGKMMIWWSDRAGFRNHGSWGAEGDIYGMFFSQEAFDKFRLSKEERELIEKKEKEDKESAEEEKEDKKKKEKDKDKDEKSIEPIEIDLNNIEDRKLRLTIHSSFIADAVVTPDGKKMYYLSKGENGYDLWVQDFVEKETKLLVPLKSKRGGALFLDKKGENLIVFNREAILKIGVKDKKQTPVTYMAEFYLDKSLERAYMFEHVWRQVQKKFYDPDLHGVDWDFYKTEYLRFLPYINNNNDFAEMLSEMLGELNASHTGSGYNLKNPKADATACLGLFYDFNADGDRLIVAEILKKGPFDNAKSKLKAGMLVEKIDGIEIVEGEDWFPLLNHKMGKPVLISIYDPGSGERWDEKVKAIHRGQEYELFYKRWVENRRKETDSLSEGRIGYVHVRGMNSSSFRKVYSELLGRNYNKEAIIVDTRFNGGGWLHDDLATFLDGKKYASFCPRGHENYGSEPLHKWYKPSIVLISEGNYSDAHGFPFAYRAMGVGKTVGMPIAGTMTAVWWEGLQDNSLYFGIPQIGVKDMNGDYLENKQFEPDVKVSQDFDVVITGRDQQLEKAVEVMLEDLDAAK